MSRAVVLEGDQFLTAHNDGETGVNVQADGDRSDLVAIDGDTILNVQSVGDVNPTKAIDGEFGTIFRTGSSGGGTWGTITGDIEDQTDLQNALDAKANSADVPVHDLGTIDLDPYAYDVWNYLNENPIEETGVYTFYDSADGFAYFIRVEKAGDGIYQEYWYTEEGALSRYARQGWHDGNAWEYGDPVQIPANAEDYYDRWQVDNLLRSKVDRSEMSNYYTADQVDRLIEGITPETMIETTWANLVRLRDSAQLVRGAWYRITDYEFTTTKANVRSGGHPFDIVVLAISEAMVSESAYAVRHAGDRYYEREITTGGIEWLYTAYADDYAESYGEDPIDHADDLHSVDVFCAYDYLPDPVSGDVVPVLFKTNIEEYDLDDPDYDDAFFYAGVYDMDGDEFDMWGKYERDGNDWVFMQQYALTPVVVEDGELTTSPIPETKTVPVNLNAWQLRYCLDNDKELFDWASTDGKGVIYYMRDEFGNEAPYDFKNAMFLRKNITATINNNVIGAFRTGELSRIGLPSFYGVTCGSVNYYYYTFDTPYSSPADSSLYGESAYNVISPYIAEGKKLINNIVLGIANNNKFGNDCHDITIWNAVRDNVLDACGDVLGTGFAKVTAKGMQSCTFNTMSLCTFRGTASNNIGSSVDSLDVGQMCSGNNFGIGCNGITAGSAMMSNTFGNYCYSNRFGNTVSGCQFGSYVSYNTFDGNNSGITLPNYTRWCSFEVNASRITFTTTGGSSTRQVQNVRVCKGVSSLTVAPARGLAYEIIYYKSGRVENAV